MKRLEQGAHHLTVISNVPITPELLHQATAELGQITLVSSRRSGCGLCRRG